MLANSLKGVIELDKEGVQLFLKPCVHSLFSFQMMTDANCVMKELSEWTEYIWGTPDEAERVRLGLPKDLYKANLMAWTVHMQKETPVQKFVNEFLFGE